MGMWVITSIGEMSPARMQMLQDRTGQDSTTEHKEKAASRRRNAHQ
jgi:hypothetical protein